MQSDTAVVAKRVDPEADPASGAPDTTEIRHLAETAGYEVVAEVTQTRREDPATNLGRGKADELAETVAETGAGVVVVDGNLTPTQTVDLADLCPEGTQVLDRYRLVLEVFADRAGSERAALQVERARLEADLPRVREEVTRELAGEDLEHDEQGGGRVRDVERRIDDLDRKLADLGDAAARRRRRRREEGFAFVALAGYTNAGKSTLLYRLADDLDLADREPDHADLDAGVGIEDRLFETLETTTRRATIDDRPTLVTDTVGFVDGLPHDLVASFHGTLSATAHADCVALVVDASDSADDLRRKLGTSLAVVAEAGDNDVDGDADAGTTDGHERTLVPVLNKVDLVDADEREAREQVVVDAVAEVVDDADELAPADPVAVSATDGRNLDGLRDRIAGALPDHRNAELVLPNGDDAMSLVSWLYDRASVADVEYGDDAIRIAFAGSEPVVERARARADALGGRAAPPRS